MTERVNAVLLVEDQRHESLVRRYLERLRPGKYVFRSRKAGPGKGSGEQHVRQRYASEVRACRRGHTDTCLIVLMDADTGTCVQREKQLAEQLREMEEGPRLAGEAILHLIPKRNIETWLLCLAGHEVDEVGDYRYDPRLGPKAATVAAATLYEWTRANVSVPIHCVESLGRALPEFGRLP